MIIKVKVNDETWENMTKGKRVEGTIGYDQWTGESNFNAFNRKSRQEGYEPQTTVLYESANGCLRKSKRRVKISASVKCSLGCKRSADQLMTEARELTEYLRHMKTIEEIMDEV